MADVQAPVEARDGLVELPVGPGLWESRVHGRAARAGRDEGGRRLGLRPQAHGDAARLGRLLLLRLHAGACDLPEREGASAVHGQLPAARSDPGVELRRRRPVRG